MSEKIAAGVPTASIVLDKKRTMAGTLGAIRRIQEHTSDDLVREDGSINEQAGLDNLSIMVWCLLTKESREELDVEDVEDLIHPGNIEEVGEACERLMKPWLAAAGAEGNGEQPATRKPAQARTRSKARK
jgi:hypothetical protein